ncbi:MAG: alpha/beta fold hydrolase [Thermoanaerobaculia bacterium]
MAATSDQEQRRRRRKRLIRGLLMGGAAVGLPALVNALVSRRARKLPSVSWGSGDRFAWKHGEIAYQHFGEGKPVVLLHSLGPGHSAVEWRLAAELLARHREVYALDLLGWGRSDKPPLTYDSELYIKLIADFLAEVVGERVILAAAGLPAAYAVQIAADQPELVRALALVVPQGIELHGDEPDFKDAIVHRLLRLPILGTSALNIYTSRSGLAGYLRREVYDSDAMVDDTLVDEHYRASHQPGAHAALAAHLSGYLNHGVRDILGRLDLPVWFLWGRQATSPPVETADLWLRQLPDAAIEVVESAGILPHAEAPEELVSKLDGLLSKLED